MSFLRKLSSSPFQSAAASRCQVIAYRPGVNAEKIKKWVASVAERATDTESKVAVAQLQGLINYYNKPAVVSEVPVLSLSFFRVSRRLNSS